MAMGSESKVVLDSEMQKAKMLITLSVEWLLGYTSMIRLLMILLLQALERIS